jgi:hypothetical protein
VPLLLVPLLELSPTKPLPSEKPVLVVPLLLGPESTAPPGSSTTWHASEVDPHQPWSAQHHGKAFGQHPPPQASG